MRFDNVLALAENKGKLQNALANWMLGFDGQEFSTYCVIQCIPWGSELDSVLPWEEVYMEFDNAIGSRGDWTRVGLTFDNEVGKNLRNKFWNEVNDKCSKICGVYADAIARANAVKEVGA